MIESKLMTGQDIDLSQYGLGVIKQPSLKELLELPIKESDITSTFIMIETFYEKMTGLSPSADLYKLDCLSMVNEAVAQMDSEEYKREVQTRYNDVFFKREIRYTFLEKLFLLLSCFFDCNIKDIDIKEDPFEDRKDFKGIVILINKGDSEDDKILIDKENFNILLKVIFKILDIDIKSILSRTEEDDEWVENNGSAKERKYIEIFKRKERERKKKEVLHICDYINVVVNDSGRDYKEVANWTYYQLINTFKASFLKDRHDMDVKMFTSGNYKIDPKEMLDWKKEIKINIDETI
ncbi:hypothetical protein [Peptostreptococcus faecalis]|uniref:hypothetical protein n=1 Tax=Peptostreptococcus faecalis TaxID=2045015 RepID=UPI000C7DB86B|nr:hypothetical protein [Peptostreptococcus faecalis]